MPENNVNKSILGNAELDNNQQISVESQKCTDIVKSERIISLTESTNENTELQNCHQNVPDTTLADAIKKNSFDNSEYRILSIEPNKGKY